ncbi:MAG: hypothetical protein MUE33_02450 [Cytophagaceae bacterium]|jgi:hypothetical protein|nr:hypothetical protein [Cytophagaceae bacterium]
MSILCFPIILTAQSESISGENPKVDILVWNGNDYRICDSLLYGTESKIKIILSGGIEKARHELILSCTQALVSKSDENNVYYITPLVDNRIEVSVEIELKQTFQVVQFTQHKKKKVLEIVRTYVPKKYVIDFRTIKIVE